MPLLPRLMVACALAGLPGAAAAQAVVPPAPGRQQLVVPVQPGPPSNPWQIPNREQANEGTVSVITAPVGGTMPILGNDLARVLDDGDRLRVLPIIGKGPVQNVLDILFLKSVDMGMVVSDVAEFYKLQYNMPNIEGRLRYIAKLYNSEIHIIAPTSIKTVFDLAGKRIMSPKDVGYFSARAILSRLNINATVDYQADDLLSLQKVIDGQADAWFVNSGKVQGIARNIKNENGRLHLVSIPYDPRLQDLYLPSKFTSDEYPNLVPPGQSVDTVAASALLVTYNWPENSERYNRVARFVDAFYARIDEFYKPPRNPKWQESSITASVRGWTRFKAAQDWLDRHAPTAQQTRIELPAAPASDNDFKQFLVQKGLAQRGNISPDEMVRIYNDFIEWNRSRK